MFPLQQLLAALLVSFAPFASQPVTPEAGLTAAVAPAAVETPAHPPAPVGPGATTSSFGDEEEDHGELGPGPDPVG